MTSKPSDRLESLEPSRPLLRRERQRLTTRNELALAVLPTVTVLAVLALVEALTEQRLLFASLASSAFLIYLDPEHGANRVRALVFSQFFASLIGWAAFETIGAGYAAAGIALVVTTVAMILADAVHPPAVATAMSFALRANDASNLLLFILALTITAVLVVMQRAAVWSIVRLRNQGRRA